MASSYVPYTDKVPVRFSSNSMQEVSQKTRDAYMTDMSSRPARKGGALNPMNWKLWQKLVGVAVIIVIIVVIIVGAVLGSRANSYPAYAPLNYSIKDTFNGGSSFYDNFDYFWGYDPTQGFVHYDNPVQSRQLNTTYTNGDQAFLGVDTSEQTATTGRHSARVSSKTQYNDGLFIFDIAHTPYGCGTWPAIWLVDQANWPRHGEIDIIESVNQGTTGNQMTLHTTDGCDMSGIKRKETGTVLTTNCLNSTDDNAGCGVQGAPSTFGPDFNAAGGGVYATEVRTDGIRTWFFPRSSIPSDVTSGGKPNPDSWGTALADFPDTKCDIGSHFQNMSITINVDLCGSWAGSPAIYSQKDGCPGTCQDLVANNASAFKNAFWAINSIKVYQAS